jgi:hypothetical protein
MVLPRQWRPRSFEVMNDRVTRRLTSFSTLALVGLLALAGCSKRAADSLGPSQAVAQGTAPSPSPVPSPSPTATPVAAPQDAPDAEPSPDCIHDSDHGVDSVSLNVYFLECNGDRIPGSKDMKTVPVGCRIHFNATPRDGSGAPTCSKTWPIWQVGPEDLVGGNGGQTFTPAYTAKAPGLMSARCIVDGVRSGWIALTITDH